jgi:hypothetical protein
VEGIALAFESIALTKSPFKRARDHFMFSLFISPGCGLLRLLPQI